MRYGAGEGRKGNREEMVELSEGRYTREDCILSGKGRRMSPGFSESDQPRITAIHSLGEPLGRPLEKLSFPIGYG